MELKPTSANVAPQAAPVSREEVANLWRASGWARRNAIFCLVFAGVFGGGLGLFLHEARHAARDLNLTYAIPAVVAAVIAAAIAVRQLLGFSRGVRSFLGNDESALAAAFGNLRRFFRLATLYVAFIAALEIVQILSGG